MNTVVQHFRRFCASRWAFVAFPLMALPLLLLMSTSTSPLYYHGGYDSAIFQELGLGILRGRIPYRDLFDNKGPLLYLLNALGLLIGGRAGLFLLQLVFNSLTLWLWFRIARLFATPLRSMAAVAVALLPYSLFLCEGNMCEEWMLPFISLAIYLVLNGLLNHSSSESSKTPIWPFVLGMCFAAVALIRLNDAVAIVGGLMVGYCIWLIWNRNVIQMFTAVWMFVSATATAVPVLFWLLQNQALDDFWYATFQVNAEYTGSITSLITSIFTEIPRATLLLLAILLGIMTWRPDRRGTLWVLLPAILLETILFGPNYFEHYYIVLLPFLVILLSVAGRRSFAVAMLFVLLMPIGKDKHLMAPRALSRVYMRCKDVSMPSRQEVDRLRLEQTAQLFSQIPDDERTSVWDYNLILNRYDDFHILPANGIVQTNRIIFPPDWKDVHCPLTAPVLPLWLVAGYGGESPESSIDSATLAHYQLVGTIDPAVSRIALYRRR